MHRRLAVVLAAVLAAALVASITAYANRGGASRQSAQGKVVTVIEHATTDATTDTGAAGDSAGDILTFANDVFNSADAKKVGSDQGSCVRTVPGQSYECAFTTILAKGHLTVEGPFYDKKDSTLAITGGTGRYRNVSGEMDLRSRAGGSKFAFVFHMTG
jgi:allene oxide cyclase